MFIVFCLALTWLIWQNQQEQKRRSAQALTYVTASMGTIREVLVSKGQLMFKHQFSLRAQTKGEVVELDAKRGQRVTSGQTLLRIKDPQTLLDKEFYVNELAQKNSQYLAAVENLRVGKRLIEVGGMSGSELRDIEMAHDIALNSIERLHIEGKSQLLKEHRSTLLSPSSGVILAVHVDEQLWVNAGDLLITLAAGSGPNVIVHIDAIDAERINVGQVVIFSSQEDSPTKYKGLVTDISTSVANTQHLNTVEIVIAPQESIDELRILQHLYVEIILHQEQQVLRIPRELIYYDNQQPFVYVQNDKGFVVRPIVITASDMIYAKVIYGLSLSDKLIFMPPKQ